MPAANNRGAFSDLFLEDMLPVINHLVIEKFNQKMDKIPFVFNVAKSDNSIEQTTTIGSFPAATEKPEGSSVDYFQFKQGFDKTYVMTTFAAGFQVTEEMIEDDKFSLVSKISKSLGKSAFETRQVQAATVFNSGFATAGPDGVALFNTAHPLLGGGTQANRPTVDVDLSVTSLEDAITTLATTRDDENKLISMMPKVLLVPPGLRFDAVEIVKSELQAFTANNNINSLQEDGLTVVQWDYLTDTNAWFVGVEPSDGELWFFERRAPKIEGDFDFDTGSGKTKITTRFDVGHSDFRGWYGTSGA